MSRPIKCRRVNFLPETTKFLPDKKEGPREIVLKVEEIEAIRLRDIEDLSQQECADLMGISRQTYQNILKRARKKLALALTKGYGINIRGGNYAYDCQLRCKVCNRQYEIQYSRDKKVCPKCQSSQVVCKNQNQACRSLCTK